jgi:pyridinium-3,5-biscarboxylic acid mononucleotide sulfurtransferase
MLKSNTLERLFMALNQKIKKLHRILQATDSAVVAFSGGVDSTFLSQIAKEVLKGKSLAVTVDTPLLSQKEKQYAVQLARRLKLKHLVKKVELPAKVMANPIDRCYKCKKEIFSCLLDFARRNGYAAVIEGSNHDDLKDYRPGQKALKELKIRSPLQEAGFTKAEIRSLSKRVRLETWNKPSNPCLATRVVYGERITPTKLKKIAVAENFLNSLGFNPVRVRLHGEVGRIEVDQEGILEILKKSDRITKKLKSLGFPFVCVDLSGYRSGSMNEGLLWTSKKS